MGHLNKTFFSYMTTEDAWNEYLEEIKQDEHFAEQWQETQDEFEEWCESCDIVLVDTTERAKQLEEAQLE